MFNFEELDFIAIWPTDEKMSPFDIGLSLNIKRSFLNSVVHSKKFTTKNVSFYKLK